MDTSRGKARAMGHFGGSLRSFALSLSVLRQGESQGKARQGEVGVAASSMGIGAVPQWSMLNVLHL